MAKECDSSCVCVCAPTTPSQRLSKGGTLQRPLFDLMVAFFVPGRTRTFQNVVERSRTREHHFVPGRTRIPKHCGTLATRGNHMYPCFVPGNTHMFPNTLLVQNAENDEKHVGEHVGGTWGNIFHFT